MRKNGFTLVEILVVIAVMAVMGVIITDIFFRTLRGGNKAQLLGRVKQNGQAILEVMDKTIRSSDVIICPLQSQSGVTTDNTDDGMATLVVVKSGTYTRYRFKVATPIENGKVLVDNPALSIFSSSDLSTGCSPTDPMSGAQVLTDTNTFSGVSLISGFFQRSAKAAGFKDIMTVSFNLGAGVGAGKAISSQIESTGVNFSTTVGLR